MGVTESEVANTDSIFCQPRSLTSTQPNPFTSVLPCPVHVPRALLSSRQAQCVGMMAKGIPSFRIGRCFGISINSSPAIPIPAALRASAESCRRWPLSPTSLTPSIFRSAHSQREWQPLGRIAYSNNAPNAPACAWRHPLPPRNPCADRINTPLTPRIAIRNAKCAPTWPARSLQHRCYSGSSHGNASRCSCGKEIAVTPTKHSKTTQDLQKVKASTLNETAKDASKQSPDQSSQDASASDSESIASYMSYLHLPRMPHRPTKEELLEAANGFWERLKVRLKWVSIRSMRPWNIDEWGAFVSWFMLGHLVWILLGTTTFFSLIILSINTVFAQGMDNPIVGSLTITDRLQKHWPNG